MEIVFEINLPELHEGQLKIEEGKSRFNVVRNGRRWGKTVYGVDKTCETAIDGFPVGCFFPTYEFSDDFWEELKEILGPIIQRKDESKRSIKLITGGTIKIWSLEKARAGRGRKYKRVIIDEAAFAKNLKESWEKAIRPTLTDLKGDAFFLSTPNGKQNYFFDLDKNSEKHANWKSFHMPSSSNPHLSQEELDEIESQLDELTWRQEFLAEYVDFTGRPFAYSFDKKKHVKKLDKPLISLPLDISFDFNVDPITAIVAQHAADKSWIRIHKEFRLKNSDIYELCDAIYAEYGDDYYYRVTGDASGSNRSAMVSDNLNYYKIIIKRLGLTEHQLFVPSANPTHRNSRVLTNSIMKRHPDFSIDEGCPYVIADNEYVECDANGEIDKKTDKHKSHLLDCERYYLNTWHKDFLNKYNENSD